MPQSYRVSLGWASPLGWDWALCMLFPVIPTSRSCNWRRYWSGGATQNYMSMRKTWCGRWGMISVTSTHKLWQSCLSSPNGTSMKMLPRWGRGGWQPGLPFWSIFQCPHSCVCVWEANLAGDVLQCPGAGSFLFSSSYCELMASGTQLSWGLALPSSVCSPRLITGQQGLALFPLETGGKKKSV